MQAFKAITLCQPLAQLVLLNRLHRIPIGSFGSRYRGRLLIHASKSLAELKYRYPLDWQKLKLPLGVIYGSVRLVDCVRENGGWTLEIDGGQISPTHIECSGRAGVWSVPASIAALLPGLDKAATADPPKGIPWALSI